MSQIVLLNALTYHKCPEPVHEKFRETVCCFFAILTQLLIDVGQGNPKLPNVASRHDPVLVDQDGVLADKLVTLIK